MLEFKKRLELTWLQFDENGNKKEINYKDYVSEDSNFLKEKVVNKEYIVPYVHRKDKDSYGIEPYMFYKALTKNHMNIKLRNFIKEMEISQENLFDKFPKPDVEVPYVYEPRDPFE